MFRRRSAPFAAGVLVLVAGMAGGSERENQWNGCRFLLGEWIGEGSGGPGRGTGECSFALELNDRVIIRRNVAHYPASADRPAARHEDLMIIYQPQSGKDTQATYWDSEGHVINYLLHFSADGRTLTMISEPVPGAPRFRLTYTQGPNDRLKFKFDIAPSSMPETFKTYIEAALKRKNK